MQKGSMTILQYMKRYCSQFLAIYQSGFKQRQAGRQENDCGMEGFLLVNHEKIDPGDDDKAKVGKVKYTQHCTDSSNFGES